jgi:DnaJ-class molecular chaperone
VPGAGSPGLGGGPPGDLYLAVSIHPHPRFERKGDHLYVDVPVPLADALLGGEVAVPTLKGSRLALHIPPESQNGQAFRLAGQGMAKAGGGQGDLFARLKVVLPSLLSDRERELIQELKSLRPS